MPISEAQLDTWAKQGATGQFTATYETLRTHLTSTQAPYASREFTIFLQGSYKNDTNIYADSDVDIVVRLDQTFYSDLQFLPTEDHAAYNSGRSDAAYSLNQFKADVMAWLQQRYGDDVKPGKKAILVKGNGTRRDADVLVCAILRRFHRYKSAQDQKYTDGICFFLPDGTRIDNFPIQHHDNCTTKHQGTRQWFKPTVRVYKNLRNAMIEKGHIADDLAPSYFVEGLLYNCDAGRFGGTSQQNFKDTLDWLYAADRSKFVCANEMFFLCHPSSPVTWRAEKCSEFLTRALEYWNSSGVKWT